MTPPSPRLHAPGAPADPFLHDLVPTVLEVASAADRPYLLARADMVQRCGRAHYGVAGRRSPVGGSFVGGHR